MKNLLTGIFVILCIPLCQAQFSAGIKGGMNFAKLESSLINTDSESGFYGGIFATYAFSPSLALQPEILYTHQAGEAGGFSYDFDLLTVPVLFRYTSAGLHLYAGGHLAWLMSVDASLLEDDDFNKLALSLAAGAGYEFPFHIELGGRYIHGLSDISDNEFVQDVHFRMWEVYAAWRLFRK